MIERERALQVQHREHREHDKRDDLLHRFELGRAVYSRPVAVGRHGEAILDEGDPPARKDDDPDGRSVNLRCPYQANVMNTFESSKRPIGKIDKVVGDMTAPS